MLIQTGMRHRKYYLLSPDWGKGLVNYFLNIPQAVKEVVSHNLLRQKSRTL